MGNGILSVLAISSAFFIFCLTRGQKMREEKNFWPELFWYAGGLIPLATVTLVWTAMENQAVPQRILLTALGAALGGISLYALGEYLRPMTPALAQATSAPSGDVSPMNSRETLASALDDLSTAIANAPPVVIGSRIEVVGGPGNTGTVIGKQITVEAGPGTKGPIIGEQITVTAGSPNSPPPINQSVAQELRAGATAIRQGRGSRAMVAELLAKAQLPASPPNVQQALAAAQKALAASGLQ
jgi:hypothetical protein